jgi:2-polyprenyl-3-methyl-5-hydroxy-6-metoxy-1,4-benzoquinol methylase
MSDLSGNKISDYVAQYYDQQAQREWERMERHRTEFAVTLRILKKHLPPCTPGISPLRVLDCGGGPGRYAIELARQGYQVTLFDLSEGNLRLAKTKRRGGGQPARV